MNVVNEPVYHRKYGSGIITDHAMTMITVEFCEEHGTKKFLYPSAFESFLELCNPIIKQKMDDELQVIREHDELEQLRQHAEAEQRLQEEEHRILLEQKPTATKKHSATKKSKAKAKDQPIDEV